MYPQTNDTTGLLQRWTAGDAAAADAVLPRLYGELHRLAAGYVRRERRGHTLQPTALVHEAYLQILGSPALQRSGFRWRSRAHFFGVAANVMRRLLVDYGRERRAVKRGGRLARVPLHADLAVADGDRLVALDDALRALERLDPPAARVVVLRYFAGLTLEETADAVGLSRKTVVRRWRRARAWLLAELQDGGGCDVG